MIKTNTNTNTMIKTKNTNTKNTNTNTKFYTIPPFYVLPRYNSLTKNNLFKRNNFHNLRKKRGYADSTVISRDSQFNLKYVLLRTKKGTLPFPLTEIFDKETFLDKVTNYIESGAIYYVIAKVNYGSGVVGRNRGDN